MMEYLVHWILAALGFVVAAQVIPGFIVNSFAAALVAALVMGLLNIVVWPLLALLTLPLTVLTFGLFLLVVNALTLKLGAAMVPGFTIQGFWPAVGGGIVLAVVGWLVKFVIYAH